LFNSGIFLVSIAGVIAVINILLISVFRRVREIGMLRAIGASDFFIRSLIYCENITVALIAGCAGVAAGGIFFQWINGLDLHVPNELLATILGGTVLRIEFLPDVAVVSIIIAVLLGLAATVYPVEAAVRIEPEAAVRRG
jgi:putative ABC transport system permease protein